VTDLDKKSLSERDICTKFITPAVKRAGWDELSQIREEVGFTKGRIIVRGKLVTRGKAKRADYILYYKPNLPIALIEAKDNSYPVGGGMQQALKYAETLDTRARNLEAIDELKKGSVDFYATVRSLYRQHRNDLIRNGESEQQASQEIITDEMIPEDGEMPVDFKAAQSEDQITVAE